MINVDVPLNSVSLGQVSVSILREFWKRGVECCIFPVNGQFDLTAYELEPEFLKWMQDGMGTAFKKYSKEFKTFRVWHISQSEKNLSNKNYLFTFHELDALTPIEAETLKRQDHIFTACDFNKSTFESFGVDNVTTAPLGLGVEYKNLNKRVYDKNVTSWFIGGKFEVRKAHIEAIRGWVETFGNSRSHLLQIAVANPFITPQEVQPERHILNAIGTDKVPYFFNFVPFVPKNKDYNSVLNSSDIVIDMSRGESYSLPSFQAVAIGKHAIVHNNTGIKQWANDKNSVLVGSNGKSFPWDNKFFYPNQPYNQGQYFTWDYEDYKKQLQAVNLRSQANRTNEEGLKLAETHTWSKTADIILDKMDLK